MYNKLFTKILDSSIWLEPTSTRLVWLTLIAAMDEDGYAQFASVANLAHRARIPEKDTQEAIDCLSAPDPNSSDPENDGKRIERVPGGWMVLNAEKYREIVTREVSKQKTRARVAKFREKQKVGNDSVTLVKRSVTPSDTDTDTDTDTNAEAAAIAETKSKAVSGFAVPACFEKIDGFAAALAGWIEHRKKIKKPATGRAVQILINKLSERPTDAVHALDTIVMNGWQSFEWSWIPLNGRTSKSPLKAEDMPPVWTP